MVADLIDIVRPTGVALGVALFWVLYFDMKDRLQPEPRRLLFMAFLLGGVASGLGLGFYLVLHRFGVQFPVGTDSKLILLYCLLVVGPIEEGAKFIVFRVFLVRLKHFDELLDGLVYSTALAIGFATFESLLYARYESGIDLLARILTAPLVHSIFAALWGFGTAHAYFKIERPIGKLAWQVVPLVAAMVLHGLYNFALLGMNSTFVACAIVLIVWLFVIWYSRRLVFAELERHEYGKQ